MSTRDAADDKPRSKSSVAAIERRLAELLRDVADRAHEQAEATLQRGRVQKELAAAWRQLGVDGDASVPSAQFAELAEREADASLRLAATFEAESRRARTQARARDARADTLDLTTQGDGHAL